MRRAYRHLLPALAHHYPGWDWTDIDGMPPAEIDEFVAQLPRREQRR